MVKIRIIDLEFKCRTVFMEHGYATSTINAFLRIVRTIARIHSEQEENYLKKDIVDNYAKHQKSRYEDEKICKGTYSRYRITTEHLVQICEPNTIVNRRCSIIPELPDAFEQILSDMRSDEKRNYCKKHICLTSLFFRWLISRGHNDLSRVDEHIVSEYFTDCSTRMVGCSLNATIWVVKNLLLFVSKNGELSEQMSKLFLFRARVDKKLKPFMPQDEIADILSIIDRNSTVGKRDYAMILLAAVTGLRGIDIVSLTLESIDWRNGEIRITQEKTDTALALPLTTDVGKSVQDYILNARPHSDSNKVFLSVKAPISPISTNGINKRLKEYRSKLGLNTQMGVHSLRRGIATSMITSGTSVITVAQALGHKSINSTKQYISLDSKNLKECALDFVGIPIGGGV